MAIESVAFDISEKRYMFPDKYADYFRERFTVNQVFRPEAQSMRRTLYLSA
jgi:hypothetical protein